MYRIQHNHRKVAVLFFPHNVQTYCFLGRKLDRYWSDLSFPSTVEVKRRGYIPPLPTHLYDVNIDNYMFASICTESFGGYSFQCWWTSKFFLTWRKEYGVSVRRNATIFLVIATLFVGCVTVEIEAEWNQVTR